MIYIRPMLTTDIPTVVQIDHASFTLPWTERSFHYEVSSNENSIPLVAVQGEGENAFIVGFIVVWVIIDEAHIGSVAVSEPYRRFGVGEALIRAGLEQACSRGALQALLEVRANNVGALELYKKLGFKVDGVRSRYYEDNHEDAILMSLSSLETLSKE